MNKTKKITLTSLFCALAYIATFFGRLPISSVGFLKYDPKDVIVVMGGFIFGPLTAVVISVAVSVIEMVTISETNIIGCVMNIVSTLAFALTASVIYERKKNIQGAVLGLVTAIFAMTLTMVVWNWLLTPFFYGMPRCEVVKMLVPVFIPFNMIKSSINAALTFLIYKPFVKMLRRTGLLQADSSDEKFSFNKGIIFLALFLILTAIAVFYIFS